MQSNAVVKARGPATEQECVHLLIKCKRAWRKKTQAFVEPTVAMIDAEDLDGSRKFLENVLYSWSH